MLIEGSDILNIPLGQQENWGNVVTEIEKLDVNKPVIIVCETGLRSKIFSSFLIRTGFKKVAI